MAINDLAGNASHGPYTPEQLLAGGDGYVTDSGIAAAAITKYQLCALLATGGVTPFVVGTHTAAQAVLAMQPAANGASAQYAHTGIFNDGIVTWPAGAALDSYEKRKAFFTGTFKVSKLTVNH